ncbi:hypothetical protein ASD37_12505 [Mycobacterium sp. Root135]|uniref:AMP-binding protein n=1 Tax=Mycobacterium sp. Root135 TaxID=1736457 RepID=UPI0006FDA63F|nr:AMP-binding protein [Mycobacterium sp. Root135]KQY06932.1 hypothetical protein ASD37_12505 [Mycobacterium sp. Root135]
MTSFHTVEPNDDLRLRYRGAGWWTDEGLAELLGNALHESRRRTFVAHTRSGDLAMPMGHVAAWGRRVAAGLSRLGVKAGDPVAFQLANGLPAAAVFYGLVHLGAILVPIGHAMGRSELRYVVQTSRARVLFMPAKVVNGGLVDDLLAGSTTLERVVSVGGGAATARATTLENLADYDDERPPARQDSAMPAVIGWTSGSTAEPKGVLLSHRALCAEVRLHMAPLMAARRRPVLSTSPVSHVTGMLTSLLVPPLIGEDVHLMDYWDPHDVLTLMQTHAVSAGTGAPLFLRDLLDNGRCGAEHHRLIGVAALGGASVPSDLIERADAVGVTALKGYGCTEHPSISLGVPSDPVSLRASTDGRLCSGVQVRIRDQNGRHHSEGTGEILTRGPDLFSGYLDPMLNVEAFDDGWYRTGDLGTLDDGGYITVSDRLKDIIIRSGLNVSAAEVELALAAMPEVDEVVVVAAPNVRTGEHGCAFVRPAPGFDTPHLTQVREHLAMLGLAKYKWPEEVRAYLGEFPRTAAGKVLKSKLREAARQAQ